MCPNEPIVRECHALNDAEEVREEDRENVEKRKVVEIVMEDEDGEEEAGVEEVTEEEKDVENEEETEGQKSEGMRARLDVETNLIERSLKIFDDDDDNLQECIRA